MCVCTALVVWALVAKHQGHHCHNTVVRGTLHYIHIQSYMYVLIVFTTGTWKKLDSAPIQTQLLLHVCLSCYTNGTPRAKSTQTDQPSTRSDSRMAFIAEGLRTHGLIDSPGYPSRGGRLVPGASLKRQCARPSCVILCKFFRSELTMGGYYTCNNNYGSAWYYVAEGRLVYCRGIIVHTGVEP